MYIWAKKKKFSTSLKYNAQFPMFFIKVHALNDLKKKKVSKSDYIIIYKSCIIIICR